MELNTPQPISQEESLKLIGEFDALKWAEAFCRATGFPDVDWALAWFANAIMSGYDFADRKRDKKDREFIGWLSADIPELHTVEVPRLADSYERFLHQEQS